MPPLLLTAAGAPMSAPRCPGKLGRHDMRPAGGTVRLKCCWCSFEMWPRPKRMSAMRIGRAVDRYEAAAGQTRGRKD